MKITAMETIRLDEFPNVLWVRLHTDEGFTGLGETFFGARAVEAWLHETAAMTVLGRDPLAIERIGRDLTPYIGFAGTGAETRGRSAVDIALWDLFGKATEQPVYQLLGGLSRERIRTYNTCAGYRYVRSRPDWGTDDWGLGGKAEGPYEDLDAFLHRADELALSLLEQGITGMKIWPFDHAAVESDGFYISAPRPRSGARAVPEDPYRGRGPHGRHGGAPLAVAAPGRDEDRGRPGAFRSLLVRRSGPHGQPRGAVRLRLQDPRPHLRERDPRRQVGVARTAGDGGVRHRDAGCLVVWRTDRGTQDCDSGGHVPPAGGPARLLGAGRLHGLRASLPERAECTGAGVGALVLHRLVPRAGDRDSGHRGWLDSAPEGVGLGTELLPDLDGRKDAHVVASRS